MSFATVALVIAALTCIAMLADYAIEQFRRAHMRRMVADLTSVRWKHKWESAHTSGFWRGRTR